MEGLMWRARAERQASQLLGIIVSCSIVVTLCLSLTHFQFSHEQIWATQQLDQVQPSVEQLMESVASASTSSTQAKGQTIQINKTVLIVALVGAFALLLGLLGIVGWLGHKCFKQEPKPYQPTEASVQRSSQFVDSTYLKYMPNTHMREPPSAPVELERNESAGKLLKPSHQRPGHVSASSASRRDLVGAALYGNSFKHWTYSSKENLPLSEADRVPVYKSREEKWERRERDMTQHYSDPREELDKYSSDTLDSLLMESKRLLESLNPQPPLPSEDGRSMRSDPRLHNGYWTRPEAVVSPTQTRRLLDALDTTSPEPSSETMPTTCNRVGSSSQNEHTALAPPIMHKDDAASAEAIKDYRASLLSPWSRSSMTSFAPRPNSTEDMGTAPNMDEAASVDELIMKRWSGGNTDRFSLDQHERAAKAERTSRATEASILTQSGMVSRVREQINRAARPTSAEVWRAENPDFASGPPESSAPVVSRVVAPGPQEPSASVGPRTVSSF